MLSSELNTKSLLAEIINDYVEEKLDAVETVVFEEYMDTEASLATFVERAKEGKRLARRAFRVRAADDFELKLASRIAREKSGEAAERCHGTTEGCRPGI